MARRAKNRKLKRLKRTANKKKKQLARLGENVPNIAKQYKKYSELPQYAGKQEETTRWFIQQANAYIEQDLRMTAKLIARGWEPKQAQDLHNLVTTKTFSQFRQKFKPPSDWYGLMLEEWTPEEIERAMSEMNKAEFDVPPDTISLLIDMLDEGVL